MWSQAWPWTLAGWEVGFPPPPCPSRSLTWSTLPPWPLPLQVQEVDLPASLDQASPQDAHPVPSAWCQWDSRLK